MRVGDSLNLLLFLSSLFFPFYFLIFVLFLFFRGQDFARRLWGH
jgi:hypothetical protein